MKQKDHVTDAIPEKLHKRLHMIYFIYKCILGAVVFLSIYVTFIHSAINACLGTDDSSTETASPFLSHMYCGTFFVEMNRDNSFASDEDYLDALNYEAPEPTAADNVFSAVTTALTCIVVISLFIAARSGDRKTLFCRGGWKWGLAGGVAQLVLSSMIAAEAYLSGGMLSQYSKLTGIFAERTWYFQIYRHFLPAFLIICAALILQRHACETNNKPSAVNAGLLRTAAAALVAVSAGFILLRAGIRTYELVRVVSGDAYTVQLPFTVMDFPEAYKAPLPYEAANTPGDYIRVVVFRYVRDMAVAAICAVSAAMFAGILRSAARGAINTPENRRRINAVMIMLTAASLIFNLMGLYEIHLFNSGFTGIYGEVTYTIGVRANCEPLYCVMLLWFFRTYMMTVPEKRAGSN